MNQVSTLGDFLSREHGLKRKIVSTTTTTYISELDDNTSYGFDEWCLITPNASNQHKINQLTQRVNDLEFTTKQLMNRLSHLEKV